LLPNGIVRKSVMSMPLLMWKSLFPYSDKCERIDVKKTDFPPPAIPVIAIFLWLPTFMKSIICLCSNHIFVIIAVTPQHGQFSA